MVMVHNQYGDFPAKRVGAFTKKEIISRKISEGVSKMKPEVIDKIKQAFAIDATVEEACYFAEITTATFYQWQIKNPKLAEEFNRLRQRPVLAARMEVVEGIKGDKHFALQYLKNKRADEFSEVNRVKEDVTLKIDF